MVDTIYALSSGNVPSGVAVVRISGPAAFWIAESLVGALPTPGVSSLSDIREGPGGELIDQALVLTFQAPKSFTGEDVVELQCHGSRPVLTRLFDVLDQQESCRQAEAGEFSRRAFENGKMDLTEIEGLADLIGAETEAQRQLAIRQSGGQLRSLYEGWRQDLIRCRALVEAELDFSDEEDVPGSVSDQVWSQVSALVNDVRTHLEDNRRGEIIRDGFRIVLSGPPNAGKSSLLNALAKRDVAIVTPIAGTTRDIIDVALDIDGYKVTVTDTAGLRESHDEVESEGIRRAQGAIAQADLVLWLQAVDEPLSSDQPAGSLVVRTKSDLAQSPPLNQSVTINTLDQDGLSSLFDVIGKKLEDLQSSSEIPVMTRRRHRRALELALESLNNSLGKDMDLELRSECLRQAGEDIGRIVGRIDVEDLLDVIFSEFCVGK